MALLHLIPVVTLALALNPTGTSLWAETVSPIPGSRPSLGSVKLAKKSDDKKKDGKKQKKGKTKKKKPPKEEVTENEGSANKVSSPPATDEGVGSSTRARSLTGNSTGIRFGVLIGSAPVGGAEFNLIHNASIQYGLMILTGNTDMKSEMSLADPDQLGNLKVSRQYYLAQTRYFFGNSLYAGGGLGAGAVSADYELVPKGGGDKVAGSVQATSIVAALTVGNLWSWDWGFHIGADWLGVIIPLSTSYASLKDTTTLISPETESLRSDVEDYAVKHAQTTSFLFLVVNMGYAF